MGVWRFIEVGADYANFSSQKQYEKFKMLDIERRVERRIVDQWMRVAELFCDGERWGTTRRQK